MNKMDTEKFKSKFNATLKELTQKLLDEKLEFQDGPKADELDQSAIDREISLVYRLRGRERIYIKKVKMALDKIEAGTFGECEDCGSEISNERLEARPTATMCIKCKEEQEREENKVLYQKRSHTLGKSLVVGNTQVAS